MNELQLSLDRLRRLMDDLRAEEKYAKRRGDFVAANQLHRATLFVSSRIGFLERERRSLESEQLELVPGGTGRRHDDGERV